MAGHVSLLTADFAGGSGKVAVIHADGNSDNVDRGTMHHRVVKSVAHLSVSNDKDHDTWFVQHAMKRQSDMA